MFITYQEMKFVKGGRRSQATDVGVAETGAHVAAEDGAFSSSLGKFHKEAGEPPGCCSSSSEARRPDVRYAISRSILSISAILGLAWPVGAVSIDPGAVVRVRLSAGSQSSDTVTQLAVEDYLPGVLVGEMPIDFPLEALKAQAVAARSFVKYRIERRRRQAFDVSANVLDQVYDPAWRSGLSVAHQQKILRAVSETEGVWLVDSAGQVAEALFHSSCGGRTDWAENVWIKGRVRRGLVSEDPMCLEHRDESRWEMTLPVDGLGSRLGLSSEAVVVGLRVTERSMSGRVRQMEVETTSGPITLSLNSLRLKLGPNKLRSGVFSLARVGRVFLFTGFGWGHGAGLCQWGAKRWAEKGWDFRQILRHYYPEASLSNSSVIASYPLFPLVTPSIQHGARSSVE